MPDFFLLQLEVSPPPPQGILREIFPALFFWENLLNFLLIMAGQMLNRPEFLKTS
jgi:hypothetical protein